MKRSGFLEHVGWTGAGIVWGIGASGTLVSGAAAAESPFTFVQISDSHIGYKGGANPDVRGTLEKAVGAVNGLERQPAFVIHTGDVTHLSKTAEFDDAHAILGKLRAPLLAIPGEHDVIGDGGKGFAAVFGRKDAPRGWYAWDQNGTHFVSLVNVFNFEIVGKLGEEQLAWLENDLKGHKASTPIVVFGHVPLYALYEAWGWSTEDGARALAALRRFDHVTILNGHIHQVITHSEGNLHFATAAATGFPQPAPGTADKPGPLAVPPDQLLGRLGYRTVSLEGGGAAVADHHLG